MNSGHRVSRHVFLAAVFALAFILVPAFLAAAGVEKGGSEAWLDQWVSQKGTTRIEVRPAAGGLYEIVVVWVSEDADARVKDSLGKVLASGFAWDSLKGEFRGGTLTELKGSECRLVPEKGDTLALVVKMGILSRTVPWTRYAAAAR